VRALCVLQVSTRLGLFYIWHRLLSGISQLKKKNRETKNQKSEVSGHNRGPRGENRKERQREREKESSLISLQKFSCCLRFLLLTRTRQKSRVNHAKDRESCKKAKENRGSLLEDPTRRLPSISYCRMRQREIVQRKIVAIVEISSMILIKLKLFTI